MRFILVLLFICSSVMAETPAVTQGIIVLFKQATDEQKNALHQKLNATLAFRSDSLNADQISANIDSETLCQEYQKENIVQYCEVLFEMTPPAFVSADDCRNNELQDFLEPLKKVMSSLTTTGCKLVPSVPLAKNAKATEGLSLLWAQQQIGNDLVKEELVAGSSVTHAILDSGFDFKSIDGKFSDKLKNKTYGHDAKHGTKTANLINSPSHFGAATKSEIVTAVDGYSGEYLKSFDSLLKSQAQVTTLEIHTLCQLSGCSKTMGAGTDGKVSQALIKSLTNKTIVVSAAGNFYPEASKDNVAGSDVIIVGSSDPYGTVSWFSDESNDVTILAPGGGPGVSIHHKDGYEQYWGTSSAAPLVSGSISNIIHVLGSLSQKEAKTLLQKTATKIVVTEIPPKRNGAGLLNSYKMFKVAQKLKTKGWPINKEALLNDPSNFDFSSEAKTELELAKKHIEKGSCEDMKKAFSHARKSFLLDQNSEAVALVENFYKSLNYPQDASFYSNLEKSKLKSYLEANMKDAEIHPSVKRAHSMLEKAK